MFTQVSCFEEEKTELQRELATTTSRLVDAKATVCELEEENVRPPPTHIKILVMSSFVK